MGPTIIIFYPFEVSIPLPHQQGCRASC